MADELKEFAQDMLDNDPSGVGRSRLQEELVGMRAGLKRSLDAGVTADEAAVLKALAESVDAATEVVDKVWEGRNGQPL